MTDQTDALVVVKESATSVANPTLQRHETEVTLPPNFQYLVGKRGSERRSITSDGYDYLNRSLGAMFYLPDYVPDETGDMVRNPIHRPDYIYMRMGAIWRNEHGQLVGATEDLEVDFKAVYQQARLDTWNSEVVLDENGQPVFGADGQPLIKVTDDTGGQYPKSAAEKEKGAMSALMSLRSTGLRYAQTVLRTRLLKIATGIKTLPGNQLKPQTIRIIGWRDEMTPNERQEAAEQAMSGMFNARPADAPSLSANEMRNIEGEDPEFGGVPNDDAVRENQSNPGHLDDRARYEAATAQPTVEVNVSEPMSQSDIDAALAAEYEETVKEVASASND